MLVALPLYDFPHLRRATDDWWRGLARAMRGQGVEGVPDELLRVQAERAWRQRHALFVQMSGYPFVRYRGVKPQIVATPCYNAKGCEGPEYCSLIVTRADDRAKSLEDLRGRILAINGLDSYSGCHAIRAMAAPLASPGARFFNQQIITGSHAASLEAIESGEAHVASIDAVTFGLIKRLMPEALRSFRVLGRSPRAPAPPYVTSASTSSEQLERIREALIDALVDPDLAACRDELLIGGAKLVAPETYDQILSIARIGERVGGAAA